MRLSSIFHQIKLNKEPAGTFITGKYAQQVSCLNI